MCKTFNQGMNTTHVVITFSNVNNIFKMLNCCFVSIKIVSGSDYGSGQLSQYLAEIREF